MPQLMTPKLRAALSILLDVLQVPGEQAVVFSALRSVTDGLGRFLHEAGVRFEVMDGRVTPSKRSIVSKRFKAKELPLLLCGTESCAEGHSWPQASTLVMLCESWALDKWLQSISRVHRLTSESPVNVYSIVTEGSLDEYLARMRSEKMSAASSVLDGDAFEDEEAPTPAELLRAAEREFSEMQAEEAVDELEIAKEWPALRAKLGIAMQRWERPMSISGSSNEAAKMDIPKVVAPKRPVQEAWVAELPLWRLAA